ncbi:MAG: methylated-DNA--[protein]-cysteine S-methyltransferase, partial [Muribaculaceae bacterium]|nr:methylated-DNA--[protein]-cysteine S-methyltransferase [Muribaculaceae bacterium]
PPSTPTTDTHMTAQIHKFLGHRMLLTAEGNILTQCRWILPEDTVQDCDHIPQRNEVIGMAISQISEYLEGKRKVFNMPFRLDGTEFRRKVWDEMRRIPYGEAITYKELARRIGSPDACRAVANACGANPFPILIPCHRVVASGGKIGGYTGGLDIKLALLELEKQNAHQ